ncbi:hypothetical protein B0J14DRAFT_588810 [Halenospora varia]|nr:hypothetical protein B0J14DRAFT_588810 [Halenospora varia]
MFRRNSSKRLSRSKSTSSVHSKHESIDPEVARKHAHAAATLAYARAEERKSTDLGHSGIKSRQSTSSQTERQSISRQHTGSSDNGEKVVKRQLSVRFAGPNAVQWGQPIGPRTTNNPLQRKASLETLRGVAITTNAPVPAAYRPPSRSSSIGKASIGKTTAESFVAALAAYDEHYAREQDIITTPSSYRRLKKSKSMFSPGQAPRVFYTNETPDGPASSYLRRNNSISESRTPQSQHTPLRAPKSMSFLRSGRQRNDEAVQMARDRFFHQAAQTRLREQPSFLFKNKAQRQEKPFRKSVRSSSGNSESVASANQNTSLKEPSLRDKARKASKTIKSKLKKVFGLIKEEPVVIPNQQVDAHETHVRENACDPCGSIRAQDPFSDIPYPDETALSRVASRNPSIRIHGSSEQLRSHAGSVRSLRSQHSLDEASRVTSWTSTAANTVSSQGLRAQADRELQRLSIINENGTHISSSSFRRAPLSNQFSAYPKVPPNRNNGYAPPPVPAPVSSARVYSALMKRLDENSPSNNHTASRKGSVDSLNTPRHIPRRSSSFQNCYGRPAPATIRHVPQEEGSVAGRSQNSLDHDHQWVKHDSIHSARAEDIFGYTGTHVHQWVPADSLREARMRNEDDVFSPKLPYEEHDVPHMDQHRGRAYSNASTVAISRQPSTKTSFYTAREDEGLTPQEIAIRNEPVVLETRAHLRESRSTFFGGSQFHVTQTTSPFRRAKVGEYDPAVVTGESPVKTLASPTKDSAQRKLEDVDESGNDEHKSQAYSESLYSRTTSGQTPGAANSSSSLLANNEPTFNETSQDATPGDVIIIDRTTYRPSMHSNSHRVTTSHGSTEWKSWMSSEVAKLERAKENKPNGSYVNYALPTMPKSFPGGHVRESAQIDDEDTEISQRRTGSAKQPLGILQQNLNIQPLPLRPILKRQSQVSLFENGSNGCTPPVPVPPPPPIPARSPLRATQSKASLRSNATVIAPKSTTGSIMSERNLLHKRNSTATLRSIKSVETPAKLVKMPNRRAATLNSRSPGLAAAVDKQFGSISSGSRTSKHSANRYNENVNSGRNDDDDLYGVEGAGLMGPEANGELSERAAQAIGSQRMVEMFLNSRRRRIAGGSEDSGAFL